MTDGNFGRCGKLHASDWLFFLGYVPHLEWRLVSKLSVDPLHNSRGPFVLSLWITFVLQVTIMGWITTPTSTRLRRNVWRNLGTNFQMIKPTSPRWRTTPMICTWVNSLCTGGFFVLFVTWTNRQKKVVFLKLWCQDVEDLVENPTCLPGVWRRPLRKAFCLTPFCVKLAGSAEAPGWLRPLTPAS